MALALANQVFGRTIEVHQWRNNLFSSYEFLVEAGFV